MNSIALPMWAGFRAGRRAKPSDGTIAIESHGGSRLSAQQKAAIAASQKRAAAMKPTLLDAIVIAYPTLRKWHKRPPRMSKKDLPEYIELWQLTLMKEHHDGLSYVIYDFSCSWDPSGISVLTHEHRVLAVGGSEVYELVEKMRPAKKVTAAQMKALKTAAKKREKRNRKTLEGDEDIRTIYLSAWAGFRSSTTEKPSSGEVLVEIETEIGEAQQTAYRDLLRRATANQPAILGSIIGVFPKLTTKPDEGFLRPANVDKEALRDLIDLRSVNLHETVKDGVAYVGYVFGCAWEREHGLGVLTHRDRVVDVGTADTAIVKDSAARDKKKRR